MELTIDELMALLVAARAESKIGGETCVYLCIKGIEYVPVVKAKLDPDEDGAVFLLFPKDGRIKLADAD